jgi:hypothetical protein
MNCCPVSASFIWTQKGSLRGPIQNCRRNGRLWQYVSQRKLNRNVPVLLTISLGSSVVCYAWKYHLYSRSCSPSCYLLIHPVGPVRIDHRILLGIHLFVLFHIDHKIYLRMVMIGLRSIRAPDNEPDETYLL